MAKPPPPDNQEPQTLDQYLMYGDPTKRRPLGILRVKIPDWARVPETDSEKASDDR